MNTVWYFVGGDLHIPPKNSKRRELLCPPNTAKEKKIIIKNNAPYSTPRTSGGEWGPERPVHSPVGLILFRSEIMNRKRGNSVFAESPAHMDGSPSVGPHTCHLFTYPIPHQELTKVTNEQQWIALS